ncbi:MAG TPA: proline iminopeptidase-family hydrolase, partial [Rhodothermia bacterium]
MRPRILLGAVTGLAITLFLTSCRQDQEPPQGLSPGEGYVDVPGGQVWYRIVGSGEATPLLVLHGGPGAPHYYLKPLAALADERPVVFYDQLGAGRSVAPNDTSLWTIDRFVRELAQVRQALGLDEVHILGQSWGTILALEYMMTDPTGVKSVIMSSPAISIPRWLADADSLVATLPDSLQAVIVSNEAAGTYDSPDYQEAVMAFYGLYLARKHPWSPDTDSTFAQFNLDLYGYMWGPSEFTATGTLKDYDGSDRLSELRVPVLFTTGRYDEATPATVAYYQSQVPGAELAILEESAHLTMQDEPEENVR